MPPGTSPYPLTGLDTLDTLFRLKNNATTTLTSLLAIGDLVANVVSTSLLDSSGAFSVDNEIIYYTAKTSSTLTGLLRGQDNTSPASHTNGSAVKQNDIAAFHNVLANTITMIEARVGWGDSTTPTSTTVLVGSATGKSTWGQVTSAMLAGSIADTKLATISTSGKISDSALSSNVALENSANVFTTIQEVARNDIQTTITNALSIANNTAATGGAQTQYSPALRFLGHAWKSSFPAGARTHEYSIYNKTTGGGGGSTSKLVTEYTFNGGTPLEVMSIGNGGTLSIDSTLQFTGASGVTILASNSNFSFTPNTPSESHFSGALRIDPGGADLAGTTVFTALSVQPAPYTGVGTSAEQPDVDFEFDRTVTWATGAIATQRAFIVRTPTYAFAGASIITNAATVSITGAPIAGTNATITNKYALWVESGNTLLGGRFTIASSTPVFDLASNVLAVNAFLPAASTTTVPAGKEFNYLRASKTSGAYNVVDMASTAMVAGMNFQIQAESTSHSTSLLHGIVGQVSNKGPGSTKAVYGRVTMESGSTGVGVGGVFAITATATTTAYILQLAGTTNVDAVAYIQPDSGTADLNDGIVYDPGVRIETNGAFLKAFSTSGHNGDFLLYSTQAAAPLFKVNKDGILSASMGTNVASATTITLTGNSQHITGTATITSISTTGLTAGSVFYLIFDSTAQISDGGNLKLASSFTGSADRVLTLLYDGVSFYETARSSN